MDEPEKQNQVYPGNSKRLEIRKMVKTVGQPNGKLVPDGARDYQHAIRNGSEPVNSHQADEEGVNSESFTAGRNLPQHYKSEFVKELETNLAIATGAVGGSTVVFQTNFLGI